MKSVGVVGCGLMGQGLAKNLLKNGYTVFVCDINEQAVQNLVDIGAIKTKNVKALAQEVDFMILSLPSPKIIKQLMLDVEKGAFNAMQPGSSILDMSTNDVELTRELHEYAKVHKIEFFDCPLSGGPAGAEDGTLTIMVGGNKKAFPSILPVLRAVGKKIEYVGSSGSGQTVKLCNNMVVGGVITLLSEALLTGEKAGVSKEKMASILQKGSGQTRVMDVFGSNILEQNFENIKFSLSHLKKDINLYQKLAEHHQIPTLISQPVQQLFSTAYNKGKGQLDSTAVYEIFTELEIAP